MGERRKSTRKKYTVWVDRATPKRYKVIDKKHIEIDMRMIHKPCWANPIHRTNKRKFQSPEQLQALVDEYFASCDGVIYNPKTGKPYLDKEGNPVVGQIKPYTITGLYLHLDLSKRSFKDYADGTMDDLGYDIDELNQFSNILRRARQRVEAYAEERLYDRDGTQGARFVLDCGFGWHTQKEQSDIESNIATNELKRKEFELKQKMLEGSSDEDNNITINITRANKE